MKRLNWGACAGFLLLLYGGSGPAQALQSYFNTAQEFRADTVDLFPKWVGMLSRYDAHTHTLDSVCDSQTYSPCRLEAWKDFLTKLKESPLEKQAEEINRFVNAYPYIEDIVNWGMQDYWEAPYEFQARHGDCDDFSIAKYMSLRALGVSDDILRITIVNDLNLGILHAVLAITLDDGVSIMDNQITQVVPASKIYHYQPIYAINEHHWWQYLSTQQPL